MEATTYDPRDDNPRDLGEVTVTRRVTIHYLGHCAIIRLGEEDIGSVVVTVRPKGYSYQIGMYEWSNYSFWRAMPEPPKIGMFGSENMALMVGLEKVLEMLKAHDYKSLYEILKDDWQAALDEDQARPAEASQTRDSPSAPATPSHDSERQSP